MTSPPSTSPGLVDVLIAYLFERLVFEIILQNDSSKWNDLQPIELSSKFAYIGEAIDRLKLNTVSGAINYVIRYRHCYKILPEHIVKDFWLEDRTDDKMPTIISYTVFQLKNVVNTRRRFATIVPEPYREEVEFLVNLMQRNGLFEPKEERASNIVRQRKEQELVDAIKELTQMDVEVLCRCVPPFRSSIKPVDSPAELLDRITKAEYDTIQPRRRYFEPQLSELTCQVSLRHQGGKPIRDILQAYAGIDDRMEPFISIVQQTLTRCGRTRETLNNLAVAMIAIHYLQKERIGPVEGRLPLEESNARDNDELAELVMDLANNSISNNKGRKKGSKKSSTLSSLSFGQTNRAPISARDINVKGFLENLLGCCPLTESFDKSPVKLTPLGRPVDFFAYTSDKFKEWDDLLPPPAEPLSSTTRATDRDKLFSGLVVQDPFVSDRNLTTLMTGWRFRSISNAFQQISAVFCNESLRIAEEQIRLSAEEEAMENAKLIGHINAQLKITVNSPDEYGDSVSGFSLEGLTKGFFSAMPK
ncbi:hypothetical protein BGW39_001031 [Mortierella sp. 14UC]|nr:hypothetical protein BGW39_001031 [Mortierella sp. 14UC]